MKKFFTFIVAAFLGGVISANAQTTLFSYTVSAGDEAQKTFDVNGGTVYLGASNKIEDKSTEDVTLVGYKMDGDNGTKFIRLSLTNELSVGDVITVSMFAASNPNGSDYGIQLGSVIEESTGEETTRTFNGIETVYLPEKCKNTLYEGNVVVAENNFAGLKEICLFRAKSKSTYFQGVTITRQNGGESGISDIAIPVSETAPIYNLAGQRVSKNTKGILIQNGKKFVNK